MNSAKFRWQLALTLVNNPKLIAHRKHTLTTSKRENTVTASTIEAHVLGHAMNRVKLQNQSREDTEMSMDILERILQFQRNQEEVKKTEAVIEIKEDDSESQNHRGEDMDSTHVDLVSEVSGAPASGSSSSHL